MAGEVNRLPPPHGSEIDRSRPVEFEFEGRRYTGFQGDVVASALAAHGVWVLSRSFKFHRPRAALSMAGHDSNVLVQIGPEPSVLADRVLVSEGLVVTPQNVAGSLRRDRSAFLGALRGLMPVGFYYRSFYRPHGAWKFWEPIIRQRAGLGVLTPGHRNQRSSDKQFLSCEIAVVGAGPAGLSAAIESAERGVDTILVDENVELGGALRYFRFDIDGTLRDTKRNALLARLNHCTNLRILRGSTCTGMFADGWLSVIGEDRLHKIRAKQVVAATGTLSQIAVFGNNDLPGVMLGSAAQRLVRLYGVRPGTRAVVLVVADQDYGVALDLDDVETRLEAVVDLREDHSMGPVETAVRARGIEVMSGFQPEAAVPRGDGMHVSALRVRPRSIGKATSKAAAELRCDLIAVGGGELPAFQLAAQAGATLFYDEAQRRHRLNNLPDWLTIAGAVAGQEDLDSALTGGQDAAHAAMRRLGGASCSRANDHVGSVPVELRADPVVPIYPHPKLNDYVDFDEDLQVSDIIRTCELGYQDIQLVKRFSTLGMGPSQGRHSALPAAHIVASYTGKSIGAVGVTTARPPLIGERFQELAGRAFEVIRRTPVHYRHIEAGASMVAAGPWLRPAFYGPASQRALSIEQEVRGVRESVGMIDVSTLGKLEIRGPDAVELLERTYTGEFASMKAGRIRYGLMLSEAGAVIDDGVIARLGREHFYVTATTSGIDSVYRKIQWWNAQWRLSVDVTNVTTATAAINVAGPGSRDLLRRLCPDIDLAHDAFPFMAIRAGLVAGISARVLRIGYVGELGYEIHVPSSNGEALWDALSEKGASSGLRPFGLEAQRLLRLEKGHFIVAIDSDALSHPKELGIGWAVSRGKPYFVGQRSLKILETKPLKRRLVGFRIDAGNVPREGSLVFDDPVMIGRVTSSGFSPTLKSSIGLAMIDARCAAPGTTLAVKSEGSRIQCEVVKLPFYDPQHERQKSG